MIRNQTERLAGHKIHTKMLRCDDDSRRVPFTSEVFGEDESFNLPFLAGDNSKANWRHIHLQDEGRFEVHKGNDWWGCQLFFQCIKGPLHFVTPFERICLRRSCSTQNSREIGEPKDKTPITSCYTKKAV